MTKNRGTFRVIIKFPNKKSDLGYGLPHLFYDDDWDGTGLRMTCVHSMKDIGRLPSFSCHSPASVDYFYQDCHPPRTKEEKKLADEFFKVYLRYCKRPEFKDEPLPERRQKRAYKRIPTMTEAELASQLYGVDNNQ